MEMTQVPSRSPHTASSVTLNGALGASDFSWATRAPSSKRYALPVHPTVPREPTVHPEAVPDR